MEDGRDEISEALIALTLRGFANGVHIAAEFGMATERDAFVTMLAKYTYLDSGKTMGGRNIEAFKTILSLALTALSLLEPKIRGELFSISDLQAGRVP